MTSARRYNDVATPLSISASKSVPVSASSRGQAHPRDLDWNIDGREWPLREYSQFLYAGGVDWHVQIVGQGPALLLLHGTGATTHSWRGLVDCLAPEYRLIMPDLPGHGFSRSTLTPSLPGMAAAIAELLAALDLDPHAIIGHSAGAAVMARLSLSSARRASVLIGLNSALLPFSGLAGTLFGPAARVLARSEFAARFFAWRATNPGVVQRLLTSTGTTLDETSAAFYRRLASAPAHVAAALAMMANWDLATLAGELPQLARPLTLIVGGGDRMIPASQAYAVAATVPGAQVKLLPALGHLAHEEAPAAVAALIRLAIVEESSGG